MGEMVEPARSCRCGRPTFGVDSDHEPASGQGKSHRFRLHAVHCDLQARGDVHAGSAVLTTLTLLRSEVVAAFVPTKPHSPREVAHRAQLLRASATM